MSGSKIITGLYEALEHAKRERRGTFDDVCRMSEHADTPQDFDAAINALAMATPKPTDAD